MSEHRHCKECDRPVYMDGEGVWISNDGTEYMCPSCANEKIMRAPRHWDPAKGCWVADMGDEARGETS